MKTEFTTITDAELIEILQSFCEPTNGDRWVLQSPFVQGGNTYATDGRVLIEIPKAIQGVEQRDNPDVSKVCKGFGKEVAEWTPINFELPPSPQERADTSIDCASCKGQGEVECCECGHVNDCEKCNGMGYTGNKKTDPRCHCDNPFPMPGTSPTTWHNPFYLNKIAALQGLEIESKPDAIGPLVFRFQHGRGLLMPVRN